MNQKGKLLAIFKMSLLIDIMDDLSLENKSIFTQKDKNLIKGFNNHFTKKYATVIDELFQVDYNNDDELLENMKKHINEYIEKNIEIK